jgi:plasmid stabilization system protein ParE
LIEYSPRARRQITALRNHYENLDRSAAVSGLMAALDDAERRIDRDPDGGLPAPRPYPHLARSGVAWIKAGRYWIAYTPAEPKVVVGVFFETADIPRRL